MICWLISASHKLTYLVPMPFCSNSDSLIRFELPHIQTSKIESATLRLFCTDSSDSGGIVGKTATDWSQSSVTWSNAPTAYGTAHSIGPVEKATWYDVDVTDLLSGGTYLDAISFRMTSNSWNRAGYSSKEGSAPPELVIRMRDEPMVANTVAEPISVASVVCDDDVYECPDGVLVSRDPGNNCNFAPCRVASGGTGLFYPIWSTGGSIQCVDGISPPSWAKGAYLKESKSDCCQSYFMLRVDECIAA